MLAPGLTRQRQAIGAGAAVVGLAALTAALDARREDLSLTIVFLLFLSAVVALSAIGGPAVGLASAVAAFVVVNFFFTEPVHTLEVSDTERIAELVIFLAVSGTVAALVDTAGRRRGLIQERTAEAEQLSAANDLRTALLRAVSHDLRTPLTTAKLATSSLLASDVDLAPSARLELVLMADREINRLVTIVEDLLAAGRLQAGALQIDLRDTELSGAVAEAMRALSDEQRSRVEAHVEFGLPFVRADQALLTRVLVNLVANALTADPVGTIAIGARHNGVGAVVDVVDHGPGMTAAQQATAMLPFQRFEDRSSGGGLGLGLSICAGFCDAMGATLTMRATPGGGLTVGVQLPVSEEAA